MKTSAAAALPPIDWAPPSESPAPKKRRRPRLAVVPLVAVTAATIPLRPLESTRVLPKREINVLILKAQSGDLRARNLAIAANIGFVRKMAAAYAKNRAGLEFEDYVSEGALGLARAIEDYEPERGYEFLTYAGRWVRMFMQRALDKYSAKLAGHFHIVSNYRHYAAKLERLIANGLAREAALERVSRDAGIDAGKMARNIALLRTTSVASLDAPMGDGDFEEPFVNYLPSPSCGGERQWAESVDGARRDAWVREVVAGLVGGMDARERVITAERLLPPPDRDPATLDEVGAKFGITRERVRQIEAKLLPRLALALRRAGLCGLTEG